MTEILTLAIGLGLGVSLLFAEAFGIAAGGMVVPGYLALTLDQPVNVAVTFGTAFVTYLIVQAMSSFLVVYGRRRTALMVLVGFILGSLVRTTAQGITIPGVEGIDVIGFIIPGLIALWFARQGVVETIATATTAAVIVRLVLILFAGEELGP